MSRQFPFFITFEGCDGSGKSTQARLLAAKMSAAGYDTWLTKEIGGSDLAEDVRTIFLTKEIPDSLTELFLISAARRDHVAEIRQKMANGVHIISDRFADSSLAYQCYAKGLDLSLGKKLIELSTDGLQPNLTILLNVDVSTQQKHTANSNQHNSYYDRKGARFQQSIIDAFLELAVAAPHRIVVIDGNRSVDEVHYSILKTCQTLGIVGL